MLPFQESEHWQDVYIYICIYILRVYQSDQQGEGQGKVVTKNIVCGGVLTNLKKSKYCIML